MHWRQLDEKKRAAASYFNILYNMSPDAQLLAHMEEISLQKDIPVETWKCSHWIRGCRDNW